MRLESQSQSAFIMGSEVLRHDPYRRDVERPQSTFEETTAG
jgi:hypothetical protein